MESILHPANLRDLAKTDGKLIGVGLALALAILTFDLLAPLGVAAGISYVTLVVLCLWAKHPFSAYLMAAVGTVLTIVGYLFSPEGGVLWVVLTNRGLAIFAIWVVAIFSSRRLQELSRRMVAEKNYVAAQTGLSDSETRLQLIIDSVPVAISYFDDDVRFLFANQAYKNFIDMGLETLIGKPLKEVLGERVYGSVAQYVERALAGESVTFENTLPGSSSGTGERSASISYVPHHRQDGTVEGFFAVVHDITEFKRVEESLHATAEKLDQMHAETQRIAHVGSWEWTVADGAVVWSDETYRIFGVEPGEFETTFDNITARMPLEDAELVARKTQRIVETGEGYEIEHRAIRPDGSVRWLMERSEVSKRDANGQITHVRGSTHDITEQKETEEQLHQARKMEAVGQLTGGIAHEFNNLLMIIIGNVESLEAQLGKHDARHSLTSAALKGALRGAELTQSLLAFSRKQLLRNEQVDINELVVGARSLLQTTLGETITAKINLGEDLWRTSADASQTEGALLNFVLNARDAMPNGGTITIRTSNKKMTLDTASHYDCEPGDYVILEVSDTGSGMTDEQLKRAFEPFYSSKEVGRGTGLGLSVAFGFAKQSGGCLEMESELGIGTTVRLSLPRAAEEEVDKENEQEVSTETVGGSGRVLVVEDDSAIRKLVYKQLTKLGYEVFEAEDGPKALALLDERSEIDLLFSDVVLPGGLNGLEVAKQACAKHPNLKVLLTSGHPEENVEDLRVNGKEVAILGKPYRYAALAEAISTVMNQDRE